MGLMITTALREIRARRKWIIAFAALASTLTAGWFIISPPPYRSAVVFYLMHQRSGGEGAVVMGDVSPQMASYYHNVTSTAMFDHLAERFDLYDHYGIQADDPLRRDRMSDILKSSINVRLTELNGVQVEVEDTDRRLAADMANEVFVHLRAINSQQSLEELKRTMRVFDEVMDSTDQVATDRAHEVMRLATEIRHLRGRENPAHGSYDQLAELEMQLMGLSARLAAANDDLVNVRRKYETLLALASREGTPGIFLKNSATVDVVTAPVLHAVLWTLLNGLMAAMVVVFIILLVLEGRGAFDQRDLGDLRSASSGPAIRDLDDLMSRERA
jgi:hypothetical protein